MLFCNGILGDVSVCGDRSKVKKRKNKRVCKWFLGFVGLWGFCRGGVVRLEG